MVVVRWRNADADRGAVEAVQLAIPGRRDDIQVPVRAGAWRPVDQVVGRHDARAANSERRALQRDHRADDRHRALRLPHEDDHHPSEVAAVRRPDRNRKERLHHQLSTQRARQGRLPAQHPQLFGADVRQPDAEHHHVEAGQAAKGCVRAADRQENGRFRRRPEHADSRDVRCAAADRTAAAVSRPRKLVSASVFLGHAADTWTRLVIIVFV